MLDREYIDVLLIAAANEPYILCPYLELDLAYTHAKSGTRQHVLFVYTGRYTYIGKHQTQKTGL